jgi:hypothetical protein
MARARDPGGRAFLARGPARTYRTTNFYLRAQNPHCPQAADTVASDPTPCNGHRQNPANIPVCGDGWMDVRRVIARTRGWAGPCMVGTYLYLTPWEWGVRCDLYITSRVESVSLPGARYASCFTIASPQVFSLPAEACPVGRTTRSLGNNNSSALGTAVPASNTQGGTCLWCEVRILHGTVLTRPIQWATLANSPVRRGPTRGRLRAEELVSQNPVSDSTLSRPHVTRDWEPESLEKPSGLPSPVSARLSVSQRVEE